MPSLPPAIVPLLSPFASLFDARTWRKVQILLTGVILAPGRRTVSTALYVLGLQGRGDFALFHHVLSRASWSSLAVSRVLLEQLVRHLVPTGPLLLAVDETLERRWEEKIEALGVYRDPVRSSHGHFVKAKGLRWVSLMLLVEVPWANRVWALPFLTVLAPSARYHEARGRRHKTITDWARQMLCLLRRWLPDRELVVVGDRTYATLKLLAACQRMTPSVTFLTRLRLDAVLHDPPPPRRPGQLGRPRVVGARQPSLQARLADPATVWTPLTQRWPDGTKRHLQAATGTALWYHPGEPTVALRWLLLRDPSGQREPQALLCTDPDWSPKALLATCLQRWQVEVAFQEVRTHLGVETQRPWSAAAIARTTPILLGLFSWLILVAHRLRREQALRPRRAAWYAKTVPTFADVLAS
ncbi:MAG: transposase, partial [Caldilineaceae bacterium SB0665_bin_21]|nr:transposase [Caldilineaceae bacterium SB0665_bin_21]